MEGPNIQLGLWNNIKRAGLVFNERYVVTTKRMDKLIMRNFALHEISFQQIRDRLVEPFYSGLAIFRQVRIYPRSNVDQFFEHMRTSTEWCTTLPLPVFKELITRLIEAQMRWNNNKRMPFDRSQHSRLAKIIRDFRKAMDDHYPKYDDHEPDHRSLFLSNQWMTEEQGVAEENIWELATGGSSQALLAEVVEARRQRQEIYLAIMNGSVDMSGLSVSLEEVNAGRINVQDMLAALDDAKEDPPEHLEEDDDEELQIFT